MSTLPFDNGGHWSITTWIACQRARVVDVSEGDPEWREVWAELIETVRSWAGPLD